jgi:mono/diheme cytochrome c family protein
MPSSSYAVKITRSSGNLAVDRDHFPSLRGVIARAARRNAARALLPCAAALLLGAAEPGSRAPDARRGEALYVGATPLSAGGAPCLGCHGVAGHGLARAASFGPDLSGAHAQYGPEGLDALLEDVVFPSMAPLYASRKVTPDERADLVAFLAEATGAPAPVLGGRFAVGVAAAAAAFLAFVVALGRRGALRRARAATHQETP